MRALIAGQGALPRILARHLGDVVVCELDGFPSGLPDPLVFRIETLAAFLAELRDGGVTEVCFAGAVRRPAIDPTRVAPASAPLVQRIAAALPAGDDALLRTVIAIFEDAGVAVRGAHELMPELLPDPGCASVAQPAPRDRTDLDRARAIHATLAAADIGQACAVAAGQALAVETVGGTDWMLATLAGDNRPPGPPGGILYKAPKPGQDRRIDLPTVGPGTVDAAARAGLSGIAIEAGGVMVLDRAETVAAADASGLFLWVVTP